MKSVLVLTGIILVSSLFYSLDICHLAKYNVISARERRAVIVLIGLAVVSAFLAHSAGTWAYAFFIILLDGTIAFHEPNSPILMADLGMAVALTLAGVLFLIIAILGLAKRNKLIEGGKQQ